MFNKVSKTFQYGQHTVTLETGEIARQASGAVVVSVEDTVVLATVVAKKDAKPGRNAIQACFRARAPVIDRLRHSDSKQHSRTPTRRRSR